MLLAQLLALAAIGAQPVLRFEATSHGDGGSWCAAAGERVHQGWTDLTLAAELGDEDAVVRLLEGELNVDLPDESGRTALARAVYHGHVGIVKRLMDAGASVLLTNADGTNPLGLAAKHGSPSLVRLLLNRSSAEEEVLRPPSVGLLEQADDHERRLAVAELLLPDLWRGYGAAGRNAAVDTPLPSLPLLPRSAAGSSADGGGSSRELATLRDSAEDWIAEAATDDELSRRRRRAQGVLLGPHADKSWAVRHLLAHRERSSLASAAMHAARRGNEALARTLQSRDTLARWHATSGLAHKRVPDSLARSAEADLRAVESWLAAGGLSTSNDTSALEASVRTLLGSYGDTALSPALGEDVEAVMERLEAHGVWAEMELRVCGGYMLQLHAPCFHIEVERHVVALPPSPSPSVPTADDGGASTVDDDSGDRSAAAAGSTASSPSGRKGKRRGKRKRSSGALAARACLASAPSLAGLAGQRVAVRRTVPSSSSSRSSKMEGETRSRGGSGDGAGRCEGYDCLGCDARIAAAARMRQAADGRRRNGGAESSTSHAQALLAAAATNETVASINTEALATATHTSAVVLLAAAVALIALGQMTLSLGLRSSPHATGIGAVSVLLSRAELNGGTHDFADDLRIGRGGFGTVWRADALPTLGNGPYAVKRLDCVASSGGADDDGSGGHGSGPRASVQQLASLQLEVELLAKCAHPHVLPVLGYSVDPRLPCLVYPLCAGGNFEDRLLPTTSGAHRLRLLGVEPAPLSWRHRLGVVRDVTSALVYLHAPTATKPLIVHRDVKPSNILLSQLAHDVPHPWQPLTAWLSDIGVAKAHDAPPLQQSPHALPAPEVTHLSTCTVRGTPGFVDALVVNGLQHSETTDGFALGVTMLMALTARPAVGLLAECHALLRTPSDVSAWGHVLDGEWPRHVAAEAGRQCPICRGETHPLREVSSSLDLGGAATFELR